jgi:hypothetical protein
MGRPSADIKLCVVHPKATLVNFVILIRHVRVRMKCLNEITVITPSPLLKKSKWYSAILMTECEKRHHFYYASLEKVIDFIEKLCVGLFGFYDASARKITLADKDNNNANTNQIINQYNTSDIKLDAVSGCCNLVIVNY